MAWSQSHLLQSLGWATLNSLWQMAALWCLYAGVNTVFRLSAARRYQLAVGALLTGFAWFLLTFTYYYQTSPVSTIAIFNQQVPETNSVFRFLLVAASVTYLALFIFPAYRLYRNWAFVQKIRHSGLRKAELDFRLFVDKLGRQLFIHRKVHVYLSDLVNSPMTIGFFKPIILLPVAALNHLSMQQVEAILLHELSHIRRADYLVNFLTSIIGTFLYFNPFVRLFLKAIEEEREHCCDELVLQYGYDKVGYASALLTLEKLSVLQQALALGATGKYYLLSRIEKIVGMEKKKGFRRNQLAAIFAALFCIVLFNSILIIREKKKDGAANAFAYNDLNTSFSTYDDSRADRPINGKAYAHNANIASASTHTEHSETAVTTDDPNIELPPPSPDDQTDPAFIHAALDEAQAALSAEQAEKVKSTVEATRKIIKNIEWKEINKTIADVMTEHEKQAAKQQYLQQLEANVDWKNVENNIKSKYEQLDWTKINANVDQALASIQLDSLQKAYSEALVELQKANTALARGQVKATPLPDQSVEEMHRATETLRHRLEAIKAMRTPRKVVRL